MSYEGPLWVHTPHSDATKATLSVDAAKGSEHRVNPFLYGKFCEHLGQNIYHGMDAQILRNPTFSRWQFGAGENLIDGGAIAEIDLKKIGAYCERWTRSLGIPESAGVFEAYQDTLAFHWSRLGTKEEVRYSCDVGPHGGRAQRIEIKDGPSAERGAAQWTALPTHRTRTFQYRIVARAQKHVTLQLSLSCTEDGGNTLVPLAAEKLALVNAWQTYRGTLSIKPGQKLPDGSNFRIALTASAPANIVISRVILLPDDHINGADAEIIARLKESKLPLLRWPGGNFVSGYRWRDGVGPIDARPTRPNPAWDGLEYNFMGTDEFIAYCKAVGCEPFICVNAGDGTPEEAAAWVQYCNGAVDTPMGRLRAENGHPQPYGIKYWEVGNEISGPWQVSWTYSGGYVDRYQRFAAAMLKADPAILLQACGVVGDADGEWNKRLIDECAPNLRCITHHLLNGAHVNAQTDPVELYHAFMGHSVALGHDFAKIRLKMLDAGIRQPRFSVTECQLFPRFQGQAKPDGKLSHANLINPATISEALYFTTLVHECIRMGDFVEMFTHSATVNHGGGLRKANERVYANPVHHAHAMSAALFNGTPLALSATSGTYATSVAFAQIPPLTNVPSLDALAVLNESGDALVIMLVHRHATSGAIQLSVDLKSFDAADSAEVVTLADEVPHGQNTPAQQNRIAPREATARVQGNHVMLTLPPYSLTRLTLKRQK
jgi:alpha-N-arabinofuranosidase